MLKVTVNQTHTIEITTSKEGFLLNEQPITWDLCQISPNHYSIIYKNKSYNAELVYVDYVAKAFIVKINGKTIELTAKDRFDLLLDQLGMSGNNTQKINDLKAPMPGMILQVVVQEGDTVQKGDTLLILEAMKMENVLKAQADGFVKKVTIAKGERVEKNQVLIKF